jgi:hypothetical protein
MYVGLDVFCHLKARAPKFILHEEPENLTGCAQYSYFFAQDLIEKALPLIAKSLISGLLRLVVKSRLTVFHSIWLADFLHYSRTLLSNDDFHPHLHRGPSQSAA